MNNRYLKIVGFGLIGDSKQKGSFRQVVFQDVETEEKAEFFLQKKEHPSMWADIEQLENGKSVSPYKGYITRYKATKLVVFGEESLEEAFSRKKLKLDIISNLTLPEAEKMRLETTGYITNLTQEGAMEIAWRPFEKDISLIKFRLYEGKGTFSWTKWFEITQE